MYATLPQQIVQFYVSLDAMEPPNSLCGPNVTSTILYNNVAHIEGLMWWAIPRINR